MLQTRRRLLTRLMTSPPRLQPPLPARLPYTRKHPTHQVVGLLSRCLHQQAWRPRINKRGARAAGVAGVGHRPCDTGENLGGHGGGKTVKCPALVLPHLVTHEALWHWYHQLAEGSCLHSVVQHTPVSQISSPPAPYKNTARTTHQGCRQDTAAQIHFAFAMFAPRKGEG